MRKSIFILFIPLFLLSVSCERENINVKYSLEKVHGYVQKGPYYNGSAITIFDLSEDLLPTGRVFSSQIIDNSGSFEIKDVKLSSKFAELKADGFYFNEITNAGSEAQLTLYAISDLTKSTTVNVNVLSSLEKNRLNYLIANGSSFEEAKAQAQSEVLKIFEISKSDIQDSEYLDISNPGEDNAILLAISAILQGYLTVAELSELIASISTDIREDGVLNSNILGVALINNASVLNTNEIRDDLEKRYEALGLDVSISDFEKYIENFITGTDYEPTNRITYPIIYDGKPNIIIDSSFIVESGIKYSIAAYLPRGRSIKIICKPTEGYDFGALGFFGSDLEGFIFHNYIPDSVMLTAEGNDEVVSCPAMFGESGPVSPTSIDFFIYEDQAISPTRIKTVKTF